jgi:hypothetical protein
MAISSGSEAERMVWQAERMDEQGRLARDWHQLLALYGFMALYGFLLLLFGSLWLSRLLYGFFDLKKPKIKSRESLLALTLQQALYLGSLSLFTIGLISRRVRGTTLTVTHCTKSYKRLKH